MILFQGKRYETKEQDRLLDRLGDCVEAALSGPPLKAGTVLSACDALSAKIAAGEYDQVVRGLELDGAEEQVRSVVRLLRRESLAFRLETELGPGAFSSRTLEPPFGGRTVQTPYPLGVLFHIAAGNVDGLPAYSAVEGLLTGNVNLLKLPQADNGLSVRLLEELTRLAPELADYLYVFDTPSTDVAAMKRLAALSDGIVTWGGDAAVSAVRALAPPGAKLMEWGHKLGFCYLVPGTEGEQDLEALAEHIMETKQLLCSSCQVVYLDTERMEDVRNFCTRFLPYLERAAEKWPNREIAVTAELSLRRYSNRLEALLSGGPEPGVYAGKGCSLTAREDSALELSPMFGNCLVKRLPRERLLPVLRKSRGYLQTAGLICAPEDRALLAQRLFRAGLVKVSEPGEMSRPSCCEGHDGEYPLRRYLRVTDLIGL